MSKYVSIRLEKIKHLSEEIEITNNKIYDYINILEKINKDYDMFTIHFNLRSNKENNIKYFDINFYLKFDQIFNFKICYRNIDTKINEYQHIIDLISQYIDLNDLSSFIFKSYFLNKSIEEIQEEISLKTSEFTTSTKIVVSQFKEMINQQILKKDNNNPYGYFKIKKDNILECIYLMFQNYTYGSTCLYQVTFPLKEDIESIYNQRNLNNSYNKNLYINIIKEEIFELNSSFFEFFNLNKNDIYLESEDPFFKIDYKKNNYVFGFRPLEQENINLIVDKIMLEKQLNNF